MRPRVFIGSSREHEKIALAVHGHIEKETESTMWTHDVFVTSDYFIDSLLQKLRNSEFAVLIFARDDLIKLRERQLDITRDNVVFELGLAMGVLGRERTAILVPQNSGDFRIPSDLDGIVHATYDAQRGEENWKAATATACGEILKAIERAAAHRGCRYLQRYVAKEEPSFLLPNSEVKVSFERLYQILLYMFKNEKVHEFRAFDLAFDRWTELHKPEKQQTLNMSNEIFNAMGRMFNKKRCKKFRRILVVAPEQLKTPAAVGILGRFAGQETQWHTQYPDVEVETRVYVYPDRTQAVTRRDISELHDFALFDGDDGTFALVEGRSSPYDHVDARVECRVVTAEGAMQRMAESFDDFWDDSAAVAAVLTDIGGADVLQARKGPASNAYELFKHAYPKIDSQNAVVIEAGYFDLRSPHDADRFVHLDDAFSLVDAMRTECDRVRDNIFLEAFLNDLGSVNVCQIDACTPDLHVGDGDERTAAVDDLTATLKQRYQMEIGPGQFNMFGMRRTRNHAATHIKDALKKRQAGIREENTGDLSVEIFADTESGEPIFLGTRHPDSYELTLRCSALLAQHYFDLYQLALQKRPNLKELWVFDFNRLTEKESVSVGAAASLVLYPWPQGFRLRIVNCIYYPEGRSGRADVLYFPQA